MAKSLAKRRETDNKKGTERRLSTAEVSEIKDALILVQDKTKPSLTKILSQQKLLMLISMAREIFSSQPMLIETVAPINVIGDIHGQYTDLLRHFSKNGWPHDTPYLFLGDYVDRGKNQLETIILLICYKILRPNTFFLLRGNHECCTINRIYGFFDETKRRYSERVWCDFQDMFNMMPLSALINGKIFCMHGGLSPFMFTMAKFTWDELRNIERPLDPRMNDSLVTDLLWADPDKTTTGFGANSRGVSHVFGSDKVEEFCAMVGVDLIARGHQVVQNGYEFMSAKRLLVTIFGATKYCGEFDNAAATMIIRDDLMVRFMVLKVKEKELCIRTVDDEDSTKSKSGQGSDRALRRRKASQKEKEKEKEKKKEKEKENEKEKESCMDKTSD